MPNMGRRRDLICDQIFGTLEEGEDDEDDEEEEGGGGRRRPTIATSSLAKDRGGGVG